MDSNTNRQQFTNFEYLAVNKMNKNVNLSITIKGRLKLPREFSGILEKN